MDLYWVGLGQDGGHVYRLEYGVAYVGLMVYMWGWLVWVNICENGYVQRIHAAPMGPTLGTSTSAKATGLVTAGG